MLSTRLYITTFQTPDHNSQRPRFGQTVSCEAQRSAAQCLNPEPYSNSYRTWAICQQLAEQQPLATPTMRAQSEFLIEAPRGQKGLDYFPNSHHETSSIDDTGGDGIGVENLKVAVCSNAELRSNTTAFDQQLQESRASMQTEWLHLANVNSCLSCLCYVQPAKQP